MVLNIDVKINSMAGNQNIEKILEKLEKLIDEYKKRNADTVITVNISLNY